MSNPYQSALDALEKDLAEAARKKTEAERQWNELFTTINVLRGKAGLAPLTAPSVSQAVNPLGADDGSAPDGGGGTGGGGGAPSPTQIKSDTFFGKRMGTAAREYLEMRFIAAGGTNPAAPREIFDALKSGGFVFETKDDTVAMISLRNMLRKASQTFVKLANGTYGLRAWYPNARKPKAAGQADDDEEDASELEAATPAKGAAA
jgi:hypothetical protein